MPPIDIKLSPTSEVEEVLFLLYRNEIPVTIADTAIVRDGVLRGLFHCPHLHQDSALEFDPDWPMVDFDSHQTRMYSTKRASEAAAKIEVAGNFFARDCLTFDAPIVIHMTSSTSSSSRYSKIENGSGAARHNVDVKCQFLTKSRLLELLRGNQLADGLICRYIVPQNRHHHLVRVLFTPFSMQLEQHESTPTVDDAELPMTERVATSSGNGGAFHDLEPSREMSDYASAFCTRLFEFFRSQGATLDRGVFFFIQNVPSRMTFLWSAELLLKPWFLDDNFTVSNASRLHVPISTTRPLPTSQLSSKVPLNVSSVTAMSVTSGRKTQSNLVAVSSMASTTTNPDINKQQVLALDANGQRLRCPSPVPLPLQAEVAAQVFADAKDFGFYSGEPERIRDAMKRQIRSIVHVQLPVSMEVDDTPPYDDDFIAALIDPEKGEAYFFPSSFSAIGKNRKNTGLLRSKSKVFRFVDTDEDQLAERSGKLDRVFGSFRRLRSGSLNTWSSAGSQENTTTITDVSAPARGQSNSELRRNSSIAFTTDPEVSAILVKHSELEAAQLTVLQEGISDLHRNAVAEIEKSKPDWKHCGHVAQLRRKYGKFKFHKEEEEAELRRLTSVTLAVKKAEDKVTRRLSTPSASNSTRLSKHLSSLQPSKMDVAREKGWVGATHVDFNTTTKFRRLTTPPPSSTEHLLRQAIPKYETKLSDGSLMGYLVDTEKFESKSVGYSLDVPLEDLHSSRRERTILGETPIVPDPPVMDLSNLHLSISQELIAQRKIDDESAFERRSMLEMLFGPFNVPVRDLQSMTGIGIPRDTRSAGASSPLGYRGSPKRSKQYELGCALEESLLSHSASGSPHQHISPQAFAEQLARSHNMEEKKKRQMNFHRHGIADSKEKIQLIVGTFEDLVYQWASDPTHDQRHVVAGGKGQANTSTKMVLFVPPAYFDLRRELRSLFLNLGFDEESVEASSIPAYQQAITDDFLEEVPQFVRLYSVDVTPVTVSRVISGAKLFAADVAQLYADEKWDIIEKIREMTETQGFTFVDAVLMVASGNLMERSSVSAPSFSFSHLKM
ncbi:Hypothetical protein, putative [Bodo saltans]|uniref:Uncharacterized protein n=1 Tax=Bodo saltans TaxID=75058 RepID=A0A0S4IQY1_BODSA|nr:Hypothetical protein, putative [Bodo saltans]|eukprot:CUF25815.1 Hypothetical protein, putative [Bodo saltans]